MSGIFTVVADGTTTNTPAAGKPAISGAPQVGRTLTAATTGITDANGDYRELAQQFRTGMNSGGYTLSSASIWFASLSSNADATNFVAAIYTNVSSRPGVQIHALSNPSGNFASNGRKEFTAPSDAVLSAGTRYWLVLKNDNATNGQNVKVNSTASAEDNDSLEGWSIANQRFQRSSRMGTWTNWATELQIRISGYANTTTTSTDATLSALALSGVTLTPVFAPATVAYTATVANSVTQTTVTATRNDDGATVAITNDDDTNTPNTATVNLSEGANTITVTVTAEDTTTTETYTVEVMRGATTNANPTFTEGADATRAFNETIGDAAVSTAANIGARIAATDTDVGDTLLYSLEGTDAARFGIIGTNGQIQTKAGEKYSYEANTSYSVMVKVEDGNGGSDTITVTLNVTDQDEAPLAPNRPSVSATAGSTTSLDVTWTPPSNTGRPGITNYDLRYQKTTESGWTNGPRNQTGATASIGSLDAGTAYRVQVLARNPEGDGAWSPSETGSTGAATSCPADAIWCATLTVQNLGGGHRGCANSISGKECSDTSHLTEDEFTHGTGYAVTSAQVRSGGELRLFINPDLTTATQSLVLLVGAERFAFANADTKGVNYRYWNNSGLNWSSGATVELKLAEASSVATLNALALSGVTLSPVFAPATVAYTATVANSVTQTTVTATKNDGGATVAITNDDDTNTPNTATVNLSEGANTITVTVTAEDTTTTETYTVVVTREATTTGACPADAVWCATLHVRDTGEGHRGCANGFAGNRCSTAAHLTEDEFTHAMTDYAVITLELAPDGELELWVSPNIATGSRSLVLHVGSDTFAFNEADQKLSRARHWNGTGLSWSVGDVVELKLTEGVNTPATGKPSISGAAQVGQTLTAAIGTIADADGLPSSFTYQWVRVDGSNETNIGGATSKTYRLVQADAGKTFKVKVSFTDDAGNNEGPLTSNEYPASGVNGELRLTDGPTGNVGRLEVFHKGEWGTVCDDRLDNPGNIAPEKACQFMGYATGEWVKRGDSRIANIPVAPSSQKIWLDDVRCFVGAGSNHWTGKPATKLHHCYHAGWGLNNCTHDEDVHLSCSNTGAQETEKTPLTAAFEDVPSNHDGSSAFTFRIAFSAEVEITPQDMRDHALTVSGGTVTAAARVDGRKDLWELTVEPAGSGPVSILTPLDRACTEAGALCTADGQALSTGLARSVPGPVAQGRNAATPLTAALSNLPAEHDGSHPFTFTLTFSEDVTGLSYRTLRDDAFDVTGGGVTKAKRATKGGNQTWAMTVQPSGNGAVTVILPATKNCTASGAICTNDDRPLSNALAATIHGPVGISVADATVTEGAGAQLDFVVSLSRSATSTVTVDYFTRNGTAIAGQDYTATSGTLTFAAGETTRTVAVPVLDDAHDEGSETMKLKLTNASGARITDRKAIGTIVNSDPLQRAWLSRFGRTVAEQVLEAVGARIEGSSPGPAQLTLGGHQVVLGASWPRAEDTLLGDAGVLGQDLRERKYILRAEADESPAQEISTAGLLMASSLHLASADGGDGRWSLWARGSRSSFSGREDALTLKGDVSTGVMGADYERGRVLAGVALAYSTGEGSYTGADARGGEVESTLASAYPYLRYTVSERLSVWGVLGLGEGGLTLDIAAREANEANERIETDVSLAMSAFGARGKLASVGGYDLAVKTDVLFVRTESEAAAGLAAADARTRRLRLTLEGSREVKLESGVLTPSLEVGLRHDGGDAETGSGLELGGGLRWAGLKGFAVEVRARGLLAHEERDYEEWGVSASLVLSPGEGGRGLTMRVGSAWGAASGGVERLWSQRALTGGSFDPDARLDAEVGYGLGAMRGLLTPYTGVALSEGGDTWRAGARFRLGSSLEVSLEASLTEPTGDGEPESGITLRGTKRW